MQTCFRQFPGLKKWIERERERAECKNASGAVAAAVLLKWNEGRERKETSGKKWWWQHTFKGLALRPSYQQQIVLPNSPKVALGSSKE